MTDTDHGSDYDEGGIPKFDKQRYNRHLRGWFSYAFARYVHISFAVLAPKRWTADSSC